MKFEQEKLSEAKAKLYELGDLLHSLGDKMDDMANLPEDEQTEKLSELESLITVGDGLMLALDALKLDGDDSKE